jgi:glycosyltransferase involved in cell wall biosynthesis
MPPEIGTAFRDRFGIEVTGYVDDIRPYVERAGCFVVPLRVGGGTRLKVLDAWAMGKAVVSTAVGCEGLEAIDGANALIRDTPEEFADAVVAVLRDEDLQRQLGRQARETVQRQYDWDIIGLDLLEQYRRIVTSRALSPI